MHPTDPKPLDDYFKEGLVARRDGQSLRDNPYSAGSAKRREWHAGFCATVADGEDKIVPALEDGAERLPSD